MPLPAAATQRVSPFSPVNLFRLLGFGIAGVAQAVSMASPMGGKPLWWLQLLSLGALVWLLDSLRVQGAGWRRAGLHGWLFSTAWLAGSFWWLFISLHTYGGLPAPLAVIAVLADDPAAQRQFPYAWNPGAGNLLLFGIAGSGTNAAGTM